MSPTSRPNTKVSYSRGASLISYIQLQFRMFASDDAAIAMKRVMNDPDLVLYLLDSMPFRDLRKFFQVSFWHRQVVARLLQSRLASLLAPTFGEDTQGFIDLLCRTGAVIGGSVAWKTMHGTRTGRNINDINVLSPSCSRDWRRWLRRKGFKKTRSFIAPEHVEVTRHHWKYKKDKALVTLSVSTSDSFFPLVAANLCLCKMVYITGQSLVALYPDNSMNQSCVGGDPLPDCWTFVHHELKGISYTHNCWDSTKVCDEYCPAMINTDGPVYRTIGNWPVVLQQDDIVTVADPGVYDMVWQLGEECWREGCPNMSLSMWEEVYDE